MRKVLALLVLLMPGLSHAAVSVVQEGICNDASNATTHTCSMTGLAAGSTVVAALIYNHGAVNLNSLNGDHAGALTERGAAATDTVNSRRLRTFTFTVTDATEDVTMTFSGATNQVALVWAEIGGATGFQVAADNLYIATPSTSTDGIVTNALTVSTQPALLWAIFRSQNWPTIGSAGTGWTSGSGFDTVGSSGTVRTQRKRVTATGSNTATFTHGTSDEALVGLLAFTEAVPTLGSLAIASQSETGYVVSYTSGGGSGTTALVACAPNDGGPANAAALKAGNCSGGAALATASETSNGAGSLALNCAGGRPYCRIYGLHTIAGTDSSVVSLTDAASLLLDAEAGTQYTVANVPWAGGAVSVFEGASPAVVDGDVWKVSTLTSPDAYALLPNADGTFVIVAGGDTSRQLFYNTIYDVSGDAWGAETPLWVNNVAPVQTGAFEPEALRGIVGVSLVSLNYLDVVGDAEGDELTCAIQSGSLPAGLVLGGCEITGTPSVENESGVTWTARITDIAGDYVDISSTYYPLETITVPAECAAGEDAAACAAVLEGSWLTPVSSYTCSDVFASGDIILTDPAEGEEAPALSDVPVSISTGVCGREQGRRMSLGLGIGIN